MPISQSDIEFRLSTKDGAQGDSLNQNNPNLSLGKYISASQISGSTILNNLFDNITADENLNQNVEYRCIFIVNLHPTLTYQGATVWLSAEVSGGADIAIAVDNIGVSDRQSTDAQATEIATEDTVPVGVGNFSSPTSRASGLQLGSLAPDECRAIWIRRTARNTAAVSNDGVTLAVAGITEA